MSSSLVLKLTVTPASSLQEPNLLLGFLNVNVHVCEFAEHICVCECEGVEEINSKVRERTTSQLEHQQQ